VAAIGDRSAALLLAPRPPTGLEPAGRGESSTEAVAMALTGGVHIETLSNPALYTRAQIELACAIARLLNRGRLVLCVPPAGLEL
jgi:hypothetical protein